MVTIADVQNLLNGLLTDLLTSGGGVTTAPVTLYCAPSGSDSNPGTQTLPLRQPAAALARIPKSIRHLVTINLAPGTYQGFAISDLNIDPASDGSQVGLHIKGTLVDASLAAGTATGTATAAANGDATTPTWATLTDAGQSWTADDLKGRFLEITSGTGTGQVYPIVANTATTVAVLNMAWNGVPASSGYAVRDQGSVIDSPIQVSPSLPPAGSITAPVNTGILVLGNRGAMGQAYILIEKLKVDLTGFSQINTVGINLQSTMAMTVAHCSFNTDIGTEVLISGPSVFRVRHCVFHTASASVTGIG